MRIGNPTPANKSGDRVATSPAIGPVVARVSGLVEADSEGLATAEALELGPVIGLVADPEPRVTAEALELGPVTGQIGRAHV